MESIPSKEGRPSGNLHHARQVAGWLGAMLAVLAASAAVVMARTHSVNVERSQTQDSSGKRPTRSRDSAHSRICRAPTNTSSHDPGLCGNPGLRQDRGISEGYSGR